MSSKYILSLVFIGMSRKVIWLFFVYMEQQCNTSHVKVPRANIFAIRDMLTGFSTCYINQQLLRVLSLNLFFLHLRFSFCQTGTTIKLQ
jgi:hypothetical protein